MLKNARYRNRGAITERPAVIETAADRGKALRHWFDIQKTPIKAFAEAMGVSRSTLNDYLSGEIDIATISPKRAAAMIEAMGVYDKDAWEILGLPVSARESFKTFRPAPAGHGPAISPNEPITLPTPLFGEQPLPAGAKIYLDPVATDKIQVIRLEDGRYYSVTALLFERIGGTHLGGLVRVDF